MTTPTSAPALPTDIPRAIAASVMDNWLDTAAEARNGGHADDPAGWPHGPVTPDRAREIMDVHGAEDLLFSGADAGRELVNLMQDALGDPDWDLDSPEAAGLVIGIMTRATQALARMANAGAERRIRYTHAYPEQAITLVCTLRMNPDGSGQHARVHIEGIEGAAGTVGLLPLGPRDDYAPRPWAFTSIEGTGYTPLDVAEEIQRAFCGTADDAESFTVTL